MNPNLPRVSSHQHTRTLTTWPHCVTQLNAHVSSSLYTPACQGNYPIITLITAWARLRPSKPCCRGLMKPVAIARQSSTTESAPLETKLVVSRTGFKRVFFPVFFYFWRAFLKDVSRLGTKWSEAMTLATPAATLSRLSMMQCARRSRRRSASQFDNNFDGIMYEKENAPTKHYRATREREKNLLPHKDVMPSFVSLFYLA